MVTQNTIRVLSLDALRGLAILMMVLSGVIPFRLLPGWMYHAQLPPPRHIFSPELAGITWVDLVFPMFLFAMGAAIPLALSNFVQKNPSWWTLQSKILGRGFLLAFFAIFLQHVRPFTLNAGPDPITWITALAGLLVMFLIFTRFSDPAEKASKIEEISTAKPKLSARFHAFAFRNRLYIHALGWVSAIVMLYFLVYPDGEGFKITRSDIILIVLANMAVFGSWVWLSTRNAPILRYGVMGVLLACILASSVEGWVQSVWNSSPATWVFKFYYLKYLFIIIPGMIAGEQLNRWGSVIRTETTSPSGNEPIRHILIVAISFAMIVATVAGLYLRWVPETLLFNLAGGGAMVAILQKLDGDRNKIIREILYYGLFWLLLGFFFEPFEGGIKKDVSTFSYYFITTGVSILILVIFMIALDVYKKQKWFPLLVENGQNPMIAYVGMMNFIYPVLGLTMLDIATNKYFVDPWMGFLRGLMYTIILAWLVAKLTRKGIIWKT